MVRSRRPGIVSRLALALALGSSALAVAAVAAPLTALAGDPCYHGFDMPAPSDEAAAEIKLAPCAFLPTVARVAPGTTVTFFNGPEFGHLITGAAQAWGDRDVELAPNATVSYRFDVAGVYPYSCALHRGMSGAIVVGDGGSAAAAAPAGPTEDGAAGSAAAGAADPGALIGAAAAAGLIGLAGLVWYRTRARRPADEVGAT